ncbi:NAD(P)H-binding protein [Aurantiacibacter sediminis]|uniref:Divinyl chlorophyllide a 8-vinyl-reductase, chloroplastic n=1 Tax=Aurantiacibacter sediminis TaxID=2793064 RepID=A0ABS0N3Q6_9SPHN|nr:NAD(P)H-binding protein [Aurantiacibacter sediminis]MBH5322362.1 NAD(P)H-binding protein [Aurantiacibacter sediminis]
MSAKSVILFGASGTIGQAVARELVERGYQTTCVVRANGRDVFPGARIERVRDLDSNSVRGLFLGKDYDAVISCIASRSGVREDAWKVDAIFNQNIVAAASVAGVRHAVLLSAICVQKPKLAFQTAKLAAEAAFSESGLAWTIVRPTAFFKSLSGQVERVKRGKPFLLFGDGELTRCKPISDRDLARFIVSALADPSKQNRVSPIGGPGPAISPREQGEMLFDLLGQEPSFQRIPVKWMDRAIAALDLLGKVSERAAAKAEYARIGRYYATESMLVWDGEREAYDAAATPEFGEDTLRQHYARLLHE